MRYIGGKSLVLDKINKVIECCAPNINSIFDVFSGSGVVAANFKKLGYSVIANDMLYFSYVINRGTICLNRVPTFTKLGIKEPIEYLNNLKLDTTEFSLAECFIYQNYSPHKNCIRMYFQPQNAVKIDIIRLTIEKWRNENKLTEDEYYYLLAALICAVPFISNITGVYAAYLKHWDARTYNDLILKKPEILFTEKTHFAHNEDAMHLVKNVFADLVYLDPPYNQRQYLPNYHILETIARYDYPVLHGVTGMRDYTQEKSLFCQKSQVKNAFKCIMEQINAQYILLSYNNEGLLSTNELADIVKSAGLKNTFKLLEFDYRRYKNKIPNNTCGLKEQLYFIRKW